MSSREREDVILDTLLELPVSGSHLSGIRIRVSFPGSSDVAEEIMIGKCTSIHALEPIKMPPRSTTEWTATIAQHDYVPGESGYSRSLIWSAGGTADDGSVSAALENLSLSA
jgi:hypothetical protein